MIDQLLSLAIATKKEDQEEKNHIIETSWRLQENCVCVQMSIGAHIYI